MVPQNVHRAPIASLSAPSDSAPVNAPVNAFSGGPSIPRPLSDHILLNDHEHSLFEILLNQQESTS